MRRRSRVVYSTLAGVIVIFFIAHTRLASAIGCGGGCSGHGACDLETGRCECFPGYLGVTCESFSCPMGIAWADYATATDVAHNLAECSAMGSCDRSSGVCKCQTGFEGVACERMSCPTCNNGRCVSMREAAEIQDNTNFFVSTTYSLWDADKIFGCQCDNGYSGFDCSLRTCPRGDDPKTTGQVDEIQALYCLCNGCTGTFTFTFRRRTTINLSPTSTQADLKAALEKLDTINGVTVASPTTLICDSSGTTTSITFTNNPGNLPTLQIQNRLSGGSPALSITTSVDGTREEVDCSNRGTCDTSSGVCKCYPGFSSSDGAGGAGKLGDCGYEPVLTAACPTTTNGPCDGKGTCSSSTFYTCQCYNGYTGMDCTIRTCPNGVAWFDGATAPDTAHAMAPCSNKGACDTKTGLCTCLAPFTGSACDLLRCPGTSSACNGRGTCKTMQQLALAATSSSGDLLGVMYGNTLNTPSTWDYNKIQGCDCIKNTYFGPYESAFGERGAFDCLTNYCPTGSDPYESGTVNEKQSISCLADGGTFSLKFRQQITSGIAFDATAAQVKAALEKLTSVRKALVTIAGGGTTVCGASTAVGTSPLARLCFLSLLIDACCSDNRGIYIHARRFASHDRGEQQPHFGVFDWCNFSHRRRCAGHEIEPRVLWTRGVRYVILQG